MAEVLKQEAQQELKDMILDALAGYQMARKRLGELSDTDAPRLYFTHLMNKERFKDRWATLVTVWFIVTGEKWPGELIAAEPA